MNIHSLNSLLYNLVNSNVNKVAPSPKAGNIDNTRDAISLGKKISKQLDTNNYEKRANDVRTGTSKNTDSTVNQPNFTPLPLRSELFPNARFFTRLDEREANGQRINIQAVEIFIYVETNSMGSIWVSLSWINNSLSVKYYTENEGSSKTLRENFSEIKGDLIELGFKEVTLSSQANVNFGGITRELLPKFDAYLLNQKI